MNEDGSIENLLKLYGTDVLRFVRFYTSNDSDAEDLTQEVFLRAYRSQGTFRNDCNPKTWLLQIAVNVCRNHHRWRSRHPQILADEVPCIQTSPSAEEEVLRKSEDAELIALVCNLPIDLKEAVVLYYFEEKPTKEIAVLLGVSVSTVKIRLFRARKALKSGKECTLNAQLLKHSAILKRAEASR